MKRTLSFVLAMLMVMSCLTAFSVISVSAEGTPGTITVFLRDFEDGVLQSSDGGKLNSVLDDGTGNKYGAVSINADELASAPKSTSSDKRPGVELGYRLRVGNNIPYISGKKYEISWDLAKVSGTTISAMGAGTSGIETMSSTNKILGWRENKWNAFSQYYFSLGAYTGENNTGDVAKQTQQDLSSGWRRYTGKPFNYLLTTSATDTTPAPDGTVGSIGRFFFEVGISDTLLKLLKDNKAYVGCGFESGKGVALTGHTFTITEADIYGDEEGLIENGGTFTREQLCKEWSLGKDCSALKSEKRSAAFAKVIEDLNFGFGIDNVRMAAQTTYYTDTVNIKGDATVRAITNTGSGCAESSSVVNGGTVTVNDYFGTTYEITAAYQPVVTYNGTAVTPELSDGVYKVVIPGTDVTSDGTLNIAVPKQIKLLDEDFQSFTPGAAMSGGWEVHDTTAFEGGFEKAADGNVYAVIKNFKAAKFVDTYISKGNVGSIYPRFRIKNPGYKFDIGRAYTVSYDYKYMDKGVASTSVSQAQTFFNFTGGSINEWDKNGWNSWVPNDTANYTQFYNSKAGSLGENGWRSVAAPAFTAISAFTKRVDGTPITEIGLTNNEFEFKGFNHGTDASHILYQLTKQAVDANTTGETVNRDAAVTALDALLKEHDLKICLDDVLVTVLDVPREVTVTATVSAGGSVKVNGASVADGDEIALEKGVESEITVAPASGYEIESVKFAGEDVTPVNKAEACVIKVTPTGNAALEVSFKDVTPKTPSIALTEKQSSDSFTLNGTIYNRFNVIQYVKIDNYNASAVAKTGVTVSDGTNSIELPVETVSAEGCFAVRVFGNAITQDGTYTFTPFLVIE